VKKPETINYRTFKPERDGLFCAKILARPRITSACAASTSGSSTGAWSARNVGGGHAGQGAARADGPHRTGLPVAHIWFLKSLPSRIGLLLDMTLRDIERVLYFESFVVIDPGMTPLEKGRC
jgi:DNA-directed RNA polymerase subunit beta'